jgi:hypothetical protein
LINKALRIIITIIGLGLGLQLTFLILFINNSIGLFRLDNVPTLIIEHYRHLTFWNHILFPKFIGLIDVGYES